MSSSRSALHFEAERDGEDADADADAEADGLRSRRFLVTSAASSTSMLAAISLHNLSALDFENSGRDFRT